MHRSRDTHAWRPATGAAIRRSASRVALLGLGAAIGLSVSIASPEAREDAARSGIVIESVGDQLRTDFLDKDARAVAQAIGAAAGMRIEGIEHLNAAPPIGFRFESIDAPSLLHLMAEHAGLLLRRAGSGHYAFGPPGERARLEALLAAWREALDGDDDESIARSEQAVLDFIRPAVSGPVLMDTDPWFAAARRAEDDGDLERAENLLRDGVSHLERLDGEHGAEYGLAVARLARMQGLRGDSAADLAGVERALVIVEADVGPHDPRLAWLQSVLAGMRREAGRDDEAEALYLRAIDAFGQPETGSLDELRLVNSLDGLATLYHDQARWAESIAPLERSFALNRIALGERHAAFQAWLLGMALFRADRLPEAELPLRHALDHEGPGARMSTEMLDAIEALGPFARGPGDETGLAALAQRFEGDVADGTRIAAAGVLRDRAARSWRSDADQAALRFNCTAYALVEARARGTSEHTRAMRELATRSCLSHASAPVDPSP